MHTQATLAFKAVQMRAEHELGPDDCVLMPAPSAHISGLLNGITLPGVVPFRTVFMARWDPETALTLIERERVTFMVGPPTLFATVDGELNSKRANPGAARDARSGPIE